MVCPIIIKMVHYKMLARREGGDAQHRGGKFICGWRPVDWVGRVLPEAKFENKTT